MRKASIILLLLIPLFSFAQKEVKLKKKYLGRYVGTVPGYKLDSGVDILEVGESSINVIIGKDELSVVIGNNKLNGSYTVMFAAKSYYLLDAKMEGQLATERILVYKRGKKLSRDGMYPQPVAELKKTK